MSVSSGERYSFNVSHEMSRTSSGETDMISLNESHFDRDRRLAPDPIKRTWFYRALGLLAVLVALALIAG